MITLFAPECGECVHCLSPRTNRCIAIRDQQGARLPARRHGAPLPRRRAAAPLHGHLDLRRVHGDAGDRAREGEPRGAARRLRAVRLRALDRDRRRAVHGAGRAPGSTVRRVRLRPRRPRRRDRRAARGRRADRRHRPVGGAARAGARTTARPTRGSRARTRSTGSARETGGFGADYTFEATGNVASCSRQSRRRARRGASRRCAASPARARLLEIVPRLLITGRRVTGSSFGGVKGRTQVPLLVDRWLAGEIDVEALAVAPPHARRGQPRLRADGSARTASAA